VCVHVRIYTYMYTCTYKYVHTHIYTSNRRGVLSRAPIARTRTPVCVCLCVCVCTRVRVYACTHTYIYVHLYMYTYTCTHTQIHIEPSRYASPSASCAGAHPCIAACSQNHDAPRSNSQKSASILKRQLSTDCTIHNHCTTDF